jgi:hypothetical protein
VVPAEYLGRTMPSFRLALAMGRRNGSHFAKPWINQMEKEVFEDMLFDIPRLYISQRALLYAVQPVNLSDSFMSFYA